MRKIKIKRVMAVILAGGMLCASLTGCSKPSDSTVQQTAGATESETQTLSGNIDNNTPPSQTDSGNVPATYADYVYDYQVSMDPIPKEIADLGGPCQGTIHAFPSKIEMGLTQKMMEEDPELKAEVEKRIPEVEQTLADEVGGEFRVDGVIVESSLLWHFFCTETSTGYMEEVGYINWQYHENGNSTLSNDCMIRHYNYKEVTEKEEQIQMIVDKNFEEGCGKVQVNNYNIDVFIAQFTDGDVDKSQEQKKILQLWEELKEYSQDIDYLIHVIYFPMIYKEVIEEKCFEGNSYDRKGGAERGGIGFNDEQDQLLLQNGEFKAVFYFGGLPDETLDSLLEEYYTGNYNENEIWDYWCIAE